MQTSSKNIKILKILLLSLVTMTVACASSLSIADAESTRDRRTGSALVGGAGAGEPPDGARASLPRLASGFDKNINKLTSIFENVLGISVSSGSHPFSYEDYDASYQELEQIFQRQPKSGASMALMEALLLALRRVRIPTRLSDEEDERANSWRYMYM